jgi:hypothetical protein
LQTSLEKPIPFLSGLWLFARRARTTNIDAMGRELFAVRRARLGADGDTVSAGYSDDGVPFARSGTGSMMNAALNSGISVFENDGLNTVL